MPERQRWDSHFSGLFLRWPRAASGRYIAPIFPVFPCHGSARAFDRSHESAVGASAPFRGAQTKRWMPWPTSSLRSIQRSTARSPGLKPRRPQSPNRLQRPPPMRSSQPPPPPGRPMPRRSCSSAACSIRSGPARPRRPCSARSSPAWPPTAAARSGSRPMPPPAPTSRGCSANRLASSSSRRLHHCRSTSAASWWRSSRQTTDTPPFHRR